MKLSITAVAVAILAGLAEAKVAFTNSDYIGIESGKSFTLKWSGGTGPYTIKLKNGASDNLKDVETIVSSLSAESYTWTAETTLTSGTYAFEIIDAADSSDPNYSPQFTLQGTAASTTPSSSTTTSASSTSSSSASKTTSSSSTSATSSASTTGSSSTTATSSKTTVTSSTRTTSSSSTTTSAPSTNGAGAVIAPIVAPLLLAAAAVF